MFHPSSTDDKVRLSGPGQPLAQAPLNVLNVTPGDEAINVTAFSFRTRFGIEGLH